MPLESGGGYRKRDDYGRQFGGGGSPILLGKTDATLAKGASGTISLYSGSTKGSEADSTRNIEGVYNRFADLDAGKWVLVARVGGGYELIAGEC